MKNYKKVLISVMAIVMAISGASMTACGGNKGDENTLSIVFYEGGFGRTWLENAANDFVAKKSAEGREVKVDLKGDAMITGTAANLLRAGTNLPDIMMTQGNAWSSFVTEGYLAPLTDAYEMEVEKLDGTKIKVKDYMIDELQNYPYMKRLAGQGENMPWVMPWSLLETSIIYNKTLLEKTKHTTSVTGSWTAGEYWTSEPKSMSELSALCVDINAASGTADYNNRSVVPFSWAGANGINYFQNIIYVLWAQQQGVETSKIPGEGSYYDFWNFESPDVWKQTGIQTAIDEWRNIIVDTENSTWKNSIPNVDQKLFQDSARIFCNQEAVMLLGGSFFENEWKNYLNEVDKFEYRMMNIPFSANAFTNDDGTPAVINYCSSDDIMFVPAKAKNVDLAVEFLGFLCNEKYLLDFSKLTGCIRPFQYDPLELTKDDTSVEWSDFFMSCYQMKTDADYNIFTYPLNASKENNVSLIYTYFKPELFEGHGVASAMQMLTKLNGKQLMLEGGVGFSSVFSRAKNDWEDWNDRFQ